MKTATYLIPMLIIATSVQSVHAFSADVPAQPKEERQSQNALPMSHDALWGTLLKAKITYADKAPYISAKIPPEIKAMDNTPVTISGFVLPLDSQSKTSHFLLSKRTPTCPYCPPGEPNEVVEVYSKKPIPWDDSLLTMHGTFTLINNTDNGIFFTLKNAAKIEPSPAGGGAPKGKDMLW